MKRLILLAVAAFSAIDVSAVLDQIDAAGVTEAGGSPKYAKMIPRTKDTGLLDSSLLPPVADWASVPIPGLYYVSSGASAGGNGSPQYPFNSLTTALSAAVSGSALVIAPGAYSGSCTLSGGASVTLCGFGPGTTISTLSVGITGSATVRFCAMRVDDLKLNGGAASVSLSGSVIGALSGSAVSVSVTRTDMGSSVAHASRPYADMYSGYNTVSNATRLVGPSGASLSFRGGRPAVGADDVAYLSDVSGATNGLLASTIRELREEDERISSALEAEIDARKSAYSSLSNGVHASLVEMDGKIDSIGESWNEQLSTLSENIGSVEVNLDALYRKETNDVAQIYADMGGIGKSVSNSVETALSSFQEAVETELESIRGDMVDIADTRAAACVEESKQDIIDAAVESAAGYTDSKVNALSNRVYAAISRIPDLSADVSTNTSDIAKLKSETTTIRGRVAYITNKESNDIARVTALVTDVRRAYTNADNMVKAELRGDILAVSNSIPTIAVKKAEAVLDDRRNGIVDDARAAALEDTTALLAGLSSVVTVLVARISRDEGYISQNAGAIQNVQTTVGNLSSSVSSLSSSLSSHITDANSRISSLQDSVTELSTWKVTTSTRLDTLKDTVNGIITVLEERKKNTPWESITIPAKVNW